MTKEIETFKLENSQHCQTCKLPETKRVSECCSVQVAEFESCGEPNDQRGETFKLENSQHCNTVKLVNCQRQDELSSVAVCKLPSLRGVGSRMTKDEKLSNWETRNTVKLVNCRHKTSCRVLQCASYRVRELSYSPMEFSR